MIPGIGLALGQMSGAFGNSQSSGFNPASFISGAASSGLGALFNIGAARRQNKRQVEFWKMQNEYNHPSAQMQRLREAGLNPNLVYGGGVSGATGLAGDLRAAEESRAPMDSPIRTMLQFQDTRVRNAQYDNVRADNTVKFQDALLRAQQTAGQGLKNAGTVADWNNARELSNVSVDAAKEQLRKTRKQNALLELDRKYKNSTLTNRVNKIAEEVEFIVAQKKGQRTLNELREKQLELKKLGIEPSDFAPLRWLMMGDRQSWEEFMNKVGNIINPFAPLDGLFTH